MLLPSVKMLIAEKPSDSRAKAARSEAAARNTTTVDPPRSTAARDVRLDTGLAPLRRPPRLCLPPLIRSQKMDHVVEQRDIPALDQSLATAAVSTDGVARRLDIVVLVAISCLVPVQVLSLLLLRRALLLHLRLLRSALPRTRRFLPTRVAGLS